MRRLDLYSEPFQATGGVASEGIRNTLGRPTMDLLTLLTRETVQNSWDARREDGGGVRFEISGWVPSSDVQRMLADVVFGSCPEGVPLREALAANPVMLAISDRGTTGLGGPLRADELTGENRDFVDFFRNVGQPPDKKFGAGTFGYGKSSLYLASTARTVLVYTRCAVGAERESRLMAAALGHQFQAESGGVQRPFTGRHWWGRTAADGVVDPLLNLEADGMAEALGLPGFERSELGTTILVLAPRFEGRDPEEALHLMAQAIVWNFWPKMIPDDSGVPPMEFRVSWEGKPIAVPDPVDHPPLHGFVRAMQALRGGGSDEEVTVKEIRSRRPEQRLGWLALHRFAWRDRPRLGAATEAEKESDEGEELRGAAFVGPARHVALMRQAQLVVRYLEGPELPSALVEYAGVFITDPEVDGAFGRAEPPTHDDWLPKVLEERRERVYINVALREVSSAVREFASPLSTEVAGGPQVPLGAFARELAGLMPWEEGTGAGVQPRAGSGRGAGGGSSRNGGGDGPGASRSRARIEIVDGPVLREVDGAPAVVIAFRVVAGRGTESTTVIAKAAVAVADGEAKEREPPVGAYEPTVLWWRKEDGETIPNVGEVTIPASDRGAWRVAIEAPRDTSLLVDLLSRSH